MDEFDFIARHLAPLAAGPAGAFGLKDDAAVLSVPAGQEVIITKDVLISGVHFIGDETPQDIARKALRVNLSDCAAMGATPHAYLLGLMLPASADEPWLKNFSEGLRHDQQEYGITLMGGDTTRTPGPLSLSVTMLGFIPKGTTLRRKNAKLADDIYVSGTMGDAALGLLCAQKKLHALPAVNSYLVHRYRIPLPRTTLGQQLRGIASACMDISDGLVQDLGHICTASGLGAVLQWESIPLSDAARQLKTENSFAESILAGGDDYELLFTAPKSARDAIHKLSALDCITRIGEITAGNEVLVLDAKGKALTLTRKGFKHF